MWMVSKSCAFPSFWKRKHLILRFWFLILMIFGFWMWVHPESTLNWNASITLDLIVISCTSTVFLVVFLHFLDTALFPSDWFDSKFRYYVRANMRTSCSSVHHDPYCFLLDCPKKCWMDCTWAFRYAAHTLFSWLLLYPCILFHHVLAAFVKRRQLIYGEAGWFTYWCMMCPSAFEAWPWLTVWYSMYYWCATEAYALLSQDIAPWSLTKTC